MSALDPKITITAIDRVTSVIKGITKSIDSLKASTAGISSSLSRANMASEDFVGKLRNLSLVAFASGASIYGLVSHYADFAEELGLTSLKTGVATESLQKLRYATSLSNISTGDLNTSLKILNKSIAVAAGNSSSDQAAAFKSMKIDIHNANGSLKDTNTLLFEMAGKFSKATDASKMTYTSMTLLGKSGTSMIPFLRKTPEEIKALEEELANLGHLWTPQELKLGSDTEESFKKLKVAIGGVVQVIAINLFPLVKSIADRMKEWIVTNKLLIADNVKQYVIDFTRVLQETWQKLINIKNVMMPVIDAIGGFKTIIGFLVSVYIAKLIVSFSNLVGALFGVAKAFAIVTISILASPITWIIAAFALIGFAIYQLIKDWDNIKAAMIGVWTAVLPYFEAFMNVMTLGMYNIVKMMYANWSTIKSYLTAVWDFLYNRISITFNAIAGVVQAVFAPILPYIQAVWDAVAGYLLAALNSILGLFGTSFDSISNKVTETIEAMKNALYSFADMIEAPFKKVFTLFDKIIEKIVAVKNYITGDTQVGAVDEAKGASAFGKVSKTILPLVQNTFGINNQPATPTGQPVPKQNTPLINHINPKQNTQLDIYMQIDQDGRPKKVSAKSPDPLNFMANVGQMV